MQGMDLHLEKNFSFPLALSWANFSLLVVYLALIDKRNASHFRQGQKPTAL